MMTLVLLHVFIGGKSQGDHLTVTVIQKVGDVMNIVFTEK